MRVLLGVSLAAVALCLSACGSGSSKQDLAPPPKVTNFALQSKLMGRQLYEQLITPAGGGAGRALLVFLHGYGAAPSDTLSPAFVMALRRLGDRAPVVLLPEGDTGWWHDRDEGPWGSYVLREAIPAALTRSGANRDRVAIGGISMGGFCAVGGHSPAVLTRDEFGFGFDNAADYAPHNLLSLARKQSLYDAPVWIDVGNHDDLRPASAKLARELDADGADVSFHVWPGAHDGQYWDAHFADYLRFYAAACD